MKEIKKRSGGLSAWVSGSFSLSEKSDLFEVIWGSRETVNTGLLFRFNPMGKAVVLIGEDIESFERGRGSKLIIDSNFMTGVNKQVGKEGYDLQSGHFRKNFDKKTANHEDATSHL